MRKKWVVYACAVLAVWIFMPEVRRFLDWRVGAGIGTLLAIVPVATLLPSLVVLRSRLTGLAAVVAVAMTAAFSYACIVGVASGNGIGPTLYTFADFILPLTAGVWFAQNALDDMDGFGRFARFALLAMGVSSAYGIVAFAILPAWDAAWLSDGTLSSFGVAAPFQFRVFGTLNGPGIFATVLVLVLTLNFSRLSVRRWPDLVAAAVCIAALALSLVRTAWIGLIITAAIYILLSPHRAKLATLALALILVIGTGATLIAAAFPDAEGTLSTFSTRINTLSDVSGDDSALDRAGQMSEAFLGAVRAPVGTGLGFFGTATKLNSSDGVVGYIDSGYLARFVELGIFGSLAMALAFAVAIATALRTLVRTRRDLQRSSLYCSLFAIEIAMLWFNASGDLLRAAAGVFFWIAAYMLIGSVPKMKDYRFARPQLADAGAAA